MDGATPGAKPVLTSYVKTVYREYTDDTFHTLKPRTAEWEHLSLLGSVIRCVLHVASMAPMQMVTADMTPDDAGTWLFPLPRLLPQCRGYGCPLCGHALTAGMWDGGDAQLLGRPALWIPLCGADPIAQVTERTDRIE
jgi:hypothetical protein